VDAISVENLTKAFKDVTAVLMTARGAFFFKKSESV